MYYHASRVVCAKTFRFLHTIGIKRLGNLAQHFKLNGISPRVHGNIRNRPKHSLSLQSVEHVVRFLLSYAAQNILLLPGGYSWSDIKFLPSSVSKRKIWRVYHSAADQDTQVHAAAYSTFCQLWRLLLPSVIIMKLMSDLCWICQQNSTAILRSATVLRQKRPRPSRQQRSISQVEQSYYRTTCDACYDSVHAHFTADGEFQSPSLSSNITLNSNDISVHYSFDYEQQVHFPSDPLQPGPIYFLTPRKCSVFGVHCEVVPRQINFLTDEAGECEKGANNVISCLHYFLFDTHGLGEKTVFLHADNCCGKKIMPWFFSFFGEPSWDNILTSRSHFLLLGTQYFHPIGALGCSNNSRQTKVNSLRAIAQVVSESADCNFFPACV